MDVVLWVIIAAFWLWELYAHFVLRNQRGHTLSNRIRAFEDATGIWGHIIVGCLIALLFIHLELHVSP